MKIRLATTVYNCNSLYMKIRLATVIVTIVYMKIRLATIVYMKIRLATTAHSSQNPTIGGSPISWFANLNTQEGAIWAIQNACQTTITSYIFLSQQNTTLFLSLS